MATETRTVWVLATRSEVEGQWLAHCLDLDIMSQGHSIEHAFQSLREAVLICCIEDDREGMDPFDREQAPEECWEPFWRVMRKSVPLNSIPEEMRGQISAVVAKLRITAHKPCEPELEPPAWQIAAIQSMQEERSSRTSCH